MINSELLYYGLGKGNSYGHVSRSKDHVKSMEMVDSFLIRHAEAGDNYSFNVRVTAEFDQKDREERERLCSTITSAIGKPSEVYGENPDINLNTVAWSQNKKIPQDLRNFLLSLSVESRQFCIKYLTISELRSFRWKDSSLPQSLLITIISRDRFSLQPNFLFPNKSQDELYKLISDVAECLPVKLGVKHFKKAIPRKTEGSYIFRTLDHQVITTLTNVLEGRCKR